MRKILLSLVAIIIALTNIYAVEDSVSTQQAYSKDVYYSMKDGVVKTEARNNWDIAFTTSKMSSSILINGGTGALLYTYPNGDTSAWSTLDTIGLSTWTKMYNSEESWEEGAFGQNALGHPDYGWGIYNMITHNLVGDSLFILKTIAGNYKKMWLIGKESVLATYKFRLANLDGSNDTVITLNALPYDSKYFIYYDANSNEVIDREPDADSWDILFTKYLAAQPQGGFYAVTGILTNPETGIAKAELVDTSITNWSDYSFSYERAIIGWNWKTFSMTTFSYTITDSLVHFIKNQEGDVYKMILTGFAGTSTGNYYFNKELLSATGFDNENELKNIRIFPNPTSDFITINAPKHGLNIQLFDLSGRIILEEKTKTNNHQISVSNLPAGIYIIRLQSENKILVHKFIVQ